jgi:hypothetical protein
MDLEFFIDCKTKEQARKEFLKLCLLLHPDKGGEHERFVRMQSEYEYVAGILPNDEDEKETSTEYEITLSQMIEKLCRLRGIDIELCGCWLWVYGDTYSARANLKEYGFKFSKKKRCWYWFEGANEKQNRKYRGVKTMPEIRAKYGSQRFESMSEDTQLQK